MSFPKGAVLQNFIKNHGRIAFRNVLCCLLRTGLRFCHSLFCCRIDILCFCFFFSVSAAFNICSWRYSPIHLTPFIAVTINLIPDLNQSAGCCTTSIIGNNLLLIHIIPGNCLLLQVTLFFLSASGKTPNHKCHNQ